MLDSDRKECGSIVQRVKQLLPATPFNMTPYTPNSTLTVDVLADALLPSDTAHDYVPVKTTGNGNCLYNSASLNLIGMITWCLANLFSANKK